MSAIDELERIKAHAEIDARLYTQLFVLAIIAIVFLTAANL